MDQELFRLFKERHPDTVLLFRVRARLPGLPHYEAFGEDAELLARLHYEVVYHALSRRAEFPAGDLDGVLRLLLRDGHRVAVCDPVSEAPAGEPVEKVVTPEAPDAGEDVCDLREVAGWEAGQEYGGEG